MKKMSKCFIYFFAVVLIFSFATIASAKEKSSSPFKNVVLKMMGMSKKTVQKEVNAVGRGIKKGADVVAEEAKDVGKLATGDKSKAKDILVKPVMGATEAVGQTAHDVIKAPIEAAQETK